MSNRMMMLFMMSQPSVQSWTNPKMTSLTTPKGTVTSPGRLHQGNPWGGFANDGSEVIYYRGYSGIQPASTRYDLASGQSVKLKRILPAVCTSPDYIYGTGCYVTLYLKGIATDLGQYVFANGIELPDHKQFDAIVFHDFYGGGHSDLVGWGNFPLEGIQIIG